MKTLNLPASWSRMSFYAKLCYLVDTHQATDFKAARKLIGRQKDESKENGKNKNFAVDMSKIRLPYSDN